MRTRGGDKDGGTEEAIRWQQRFHFTLWGLTTHADRMWACCPRFGEGGGQEERMKI